MYVVITFRAELQTSGGATGERVEQAVGGGRRKPSGSCRAHLTKAALQVCVAAPQSKFVVPDWQAGTASGTWGAPATDP